MTKTCTKCHAAKPLAMFSRESAHSDRLRTVCKTCRAAQLRANRKDRAKRFHAAPSPRSLLSVGWMEFNLACTKWLLANGFSCDPQPSLFTT